MLSIKNVLDEFSKLPMRSELQTRILRRTNQKELITIIITNTEIEVVRPCDDGKGSFTKNGT